MTKITATLLFIASLGLAGCGGDQYYGATSYRSASASMDNSRINTDYERGCKTRKRWMDCDGTRTAAEAGGGQ